VLKLKGKDGLDYTRIDSLDDLRKVLAHGMQEFKMVLNGGLFSRKELALEPDGRFWVFNHIDGSEFTLTAEELIDRNVTLIGEAVTKGAFWMFGKQN